MKPRAKANYSEELREELLKTYLDALRHYMPVDETYFRQQLRHFVLFRTLQVLGAYGFRGYFEKKPHFLQSVPYAIDNLRRLLREPFKEYPYLSKILTELTQMRQFSEMNPQRKLEVKIYSFAYKKGIPNDITGNGALYIIRDTKKTFQQKNVAIYLRKILLIALIIFINVCHKFSIKSYH